MKKRILAVILSTVMTVTMLVGCGDSVETGGRAETGNSMQAVTSENGESLFPDTIFDDIEILDSTLTDVEKLFDVRGLAYEESNYGFIGTTISDELYDWEAKYFCDFMIKDNYFDIDGQTHIDDSYEFTEEDAVLTQWTTILFLNEDSEYRDSVKLIQNIIDQNKLDSYDALEMTYDYLKVFYRLEGFENGEVVCYPTERLKYAGIDCLKYILFGKVPNYNKDGNNHAIFFTVGIMFEEYYQEEDFLPVGLSALQTPRPVDKSSVIVSDYDSVSINPNLESEISDGYWNIALFCIDNKDETGLYKGSENNNCIIISIDRGTQLTKFVNINANTYLNMGDTYGKVQEAYSMGGAQQALEMLNMNLDMNISDFISIGLPTRIQFIDGLGGIWVDVDNDRKDDINQRVEAYLNEFEPLYITEQVKNDYIPIENVGYQKISGLDVMALCWSDKRNTLEINIGVVVQMKYMWKNDSAKLAQLFDSLRNDIYTNLNQEELDEFFDILCNKGGIYYSDIVDFPRSDLRQSVNMGERGLCLVPMDLNENVAVLHDFLFYLSNHEVSNIVQEISAQILEDASRYMSE